MTLRGHFVDKSLAHVGNFMQLSTRTDGKELVPGPKTFQKGLLDLHGGGGGGDAVTFKKNKREMSPRVPTRSQQVS